MEDLSVTGPFFRSSIPPVMMVPLDLEGQHDDLLKEIANPTYS
jgi:hypothetical protein